MKMEHSKMRSESSECTWIAKAILIHLESYLEISCAVWGRNWMNPDMHTVLLDTKPVNVTLLKNYIPILMATILKALRERSKEK